MNLNQLTTAIEKWAIDKGLDKADPAKQMLKVTEEHGELAAALARGDKEKIMDGVGDGFVTHVVLCLQLGLKIDDCIEAAYNEIKERKGKMINGVFVKEEDLQGVAK